MELVESIKTILLAQYEWYKFLTSEWLFFRLGPVCLVVESVITYILIVKKEESKDAKDRKQCLRLYWKVNIVKICFVLYLTYLIVSDSGRATYNSLMGIMIAYYIYTTVLVTVITISLFVKVVKKAVGKNNIN